MVANLSISLIVTAILVISFIIVPLVIRNTFHAPIVDGDDGFVVRVV